MNSLDDRFINENKLEQLLSVEDFTSPEAEVNPVNLVMNQIILNLESLGIFGEPEIRRGSPITTVKENFDDLLFPPDAIMRTPLHTFRIEDERLLRTQMSCMLPNILAEGDFEDKRLIVCPGLVYRKEGPHHQMDIWYIKRTEIPFESHDVLRIINVISEELIPEQERVFKDKALYYIHSGYKLKTEFQGRSQTFIDGGIVVPQVLANAGLNPSEYQAIAIGLSLDRLALYKKGIEDPRVLRSKDQRIRPQLANLDPYKEVSNYPSINRDISITVDSQIAKEDIQFILSHTFDNDLLATIESLDIITSTDYGDLPEQARERLGINNGQKNILLRIKLRSFERTLTKQEANEIRDQAMDTLNGLSVEKINEIRSLYREQ